MKKKENAQVTTAESIVRLEQQVIALKEAFQNYCVQNEKMQVERAKRLREQLIKSDNALEHRLGGMNEFRAQISSERASYVTNEKLDLRLKPLERMFWGISVIVALVVVVVLPLLVLWLR